MRPVKSLSAWLNQTLTQANSLSSKKLFLFCFIIFFLALGVKALYWQDNAQSTVNNFSALAYDTEAERILQGKGILFPTEESRSSDVRLLVHPPGYSVLVAISFLLFGNSLLPLTIINQIFDSFAVIVIFLIGIELLPIGVATVGSLLATFSPHFAFYGLNASPESPTNLLLLLAILFLVKTIKNFKLKYVIFSGVLIGLSCWLRPNALALAPFLTIVFLPFLEAKNRIRYISSLVLASAIVISPITIRNFIVFKEFIPISIGVGANLLEGIADYDKENKFGFPGDDQAVAKYDVKLYNRPDYGSTQWAPDGLMREKNRVKIAKEAIKNNPIWFLGVMLKRITFMLSYNSKGSAPWPLNTAIVPILKGEASFGHSLEETGKTSWSITPAILATEGKTISPETKIYLENIENLENLENLDRELVIIGDKSAYNDQFVSPIIKVTPNTDYKLIVDVRQQNQSAIKIASSNLRDILATEILLGVTPKKQETLLEKVYVTVPFSSGSRNEIRIVLSNDGINQPQTNIKQIELRQLGATPRVWTKPIRIFVRTLQKNIYNTKEILPFLFLGLVILVLSKKNQILVVLLAIPFYFFCFQSVLHTEYRYIYIIHYFLFLFGSLAIYILWKSLAMIATKIKSKLVK
jgi:hypothetical protein